MTTRKKFTKTNKDLAEQGQIAACATAVRVSTVLYNRWTHH